MRICVYPGMRVVAYPDVCMLPSSRLKRLRLINQHDRDVVPNFVAELASVTNQLVRLLPVFELALAFRTHEDFQQLLI